MYQVWSKSIKGSQIIDLMANIFGNLNLHITIMFHAILDIFSIVQVFSDISTHDD